MYWLWNNLPLTMFMLADCIGIKTNSMHSLHRLKKMYRYLPPLGCQMVWQKEDMPRCLASCPLSGRKKTKNQGNVRLFYVCSIGLLVIISCQFMTPWHAHAVPKFPSGPTNKRSSFLQALQTKGLVCSISSRRFWVMLQCIVYETMVKLLIFFTWETSDSGLKCSGFLCSA